MDRADYFKKKGSTVDAKFARLHRRSIDQRNVRGMAFMENRSLDVLAFSPVKEDRLKAAMPPPTAAPPKAKKGSGAHNKSLSGPSKSAPVPLVKAAAPATGMTRREKLMKWREEKELKRKQMASKAKPQVFRVSKALDHKEDTKLFMSSQTKTKPAAKPAAKPVSRPAPVVQRATRSSTKSSAKPPTNGVKGTSRTRAPIKKVEPAPLTRTKKGPPPPSKPPSSRMPTARSVSSDRAPPTRQSARLASKQAPPPQAKTGHSRRAKVEKRAPVVEKVAPVAEKEEEEEEEVVKEEEKAEYEVEPAKPVVDEASFNVTNQRGSSMLTDTFGQSGGFTFSMAVPDLPFTPISPASASIFLFPAAKSNTNLTPSQRRCSTPYSLRPLRSLGKQTPHEPIPPQPDMTEEEDVTMETETCKPAKPECHVTPETENKPGIADNDRTSVPLEEVPMETENTGEAKSNVKGEPMSEEPVKGKPSETGDTSPVQEKDVPYFKNLVSSETARLLDRCSIWDKIMSDNELSEEVCGEIRSAIGKAKLLIDQRFKQFLGLVKNCEFGLGEKVTHCSDLEGFWEMIYFQVDDVDALFKELEKLQANNWQKEEEKKMDKPKIIKKKKPITKKPVGGDAAAKRNAARERLLAAKAAMQAKATRKAESEKVVFEGGFFKVESPARKATPAKTKELHEDGLSRQALQNRTNIMASPASTMCSPALQKRNNFLASPATTLCSPALKKMTILASPGSNLCSPALQKRTNIMGSPAANLCSPLRRKTRKSSMGFGLSQAASLFTPEKDTPEKGVQDLISWD